MDINMIYTNAGLELMAKLEQGCVLRITRIVGGVGHCESLPELTEITDIRQSFEIMAMEQRGTQAIIYTLLKNDDLTQGYDLTQIGVFAEDPDKGEILYRVAQLTHAFPVSSAQNLPGFSMDFVIYDSISNASHMEVIVDPAGMVTQRQLADALAAHTTVITSPAQPVAQPESGLWLDTSGEQPPAGGEVALIVGNAVISDTEPTDASLWFKT